MEDGGKACGDISHRLCPEEEVLEVDVQTTEVVASVATKHELPAPLPTGVTTEETRGGGREGDKEAKGMEEEFMEVSASSEGVVVSEHIQPEQVTASQASLPDEVVDTNSPESETDNIVFDE